MGSIWSPHILLGLVRDRTEVRTWMTRSESSALCCEKGFRAHDHRPVAAYESDSCKKQSAEYGSFYAMYIN